MAKKVFTEEEARERKNARQREYSKKTGYAAQEKYKKENSKQYIVRVMLTTESDIAEKLESVDNKAGYIKRLIREDIEREKKILKNFSKNY